MEESTAATNAETLKQQLKKILTEILSYGGGEIKDGGGGVLKSIEEAIGILDCLREAELKMPDSDIPSSSSSSNATTSEPVVIASKETFEKRYITEWLKHDPNCPKSDAVLSHSLWTPNYLVDELIKQWCRANIYDRLKSSNEIVTKELKEGIESWLQRISSPTSVEDQTEAAKELRRQTKKFAYVRAFFVAESSNSITRLLSPLSALGEAVHSNSDLQESLATTLLYISTFEQNNTVIARNPLVIPLLTKSLKQGTAKTRRNSAAALLALSALHSNKSIIGNSETLKALIHVIKEGDAAIEAASAVFNLCSLLENKKKAVSEGLIPVLTNKIKAGSNLNRFLAVFALMSTHKTAMFDLPSVVVDEILARLPIETLKLAKTVCKDFYYRSFQSSFYYKHLDMSEGRFIRFDKMLRVIDTVASVVTASAIPNCLQHGDSISTVTHCDGLLLLTMTHDTRVLIWNPHSMGPRWIIPMEGWGSKTDPQGYNRFGMGYSSNERTHYKVLRLFKKENEENEDLVAVYETKHGRWRKLDVILDWKVEISHPSALSVGGKIVWLATREGSEIFVQSFDFSTERFIDICQLPNGVNSGSTKSLSVYNRGNLSLLHQGSNTTAIDIWVSNVLTDEAVSWKPHFRIAELELPKLGHFYESSYPVHFINEEGTAVVLCREYDGVEDIDELTERGELGDVHIRLYKIGRKGIQNRVELEEPVFFEHLMCGYVYTPSEVPLYSQ